MRQTYRQVISRNEVPPNAAFIRLWRDEGRARAEVVTGDDAPPVVTDPDLALFMANLALNQHDLYGLFVCLDDRALWQDEWGNLARY
jgi:hypothetical protein